MSQHTIQVLPDNIMVTATSCARFGLYGTFELGSEFCYTASISAKEVDLGIANDFKRTEEL